MIIFTPSDILSLPECYQSFMKCKTLPVNITQSYQPPYVNILIHCFRSSAPTQHHQLYLIIRCNSDYVLLNDTAGHCYFLQYRRHIFFLSIDLDIILLSGE